MTLRGPLPRDLPLIVLVTTTISFAFAIYSHPTGRRDEHSTKRTSPLFFLLRWQKLRTRFLFEEEARLRDNVTRPAPDHQVIRLRRQVRDLAIHALLILCAMLCSAMRAAMRW